MIPHVSDHEEHKHLVRSITSVFAHQLLNESRGDRIDYMTKHHFLQKYAYFVLNSDTNDILIYLEPFLDNFNRSEAVSDLLKEFVLAEDSLKTYDKFWMVWNAFKDKIIDICKDGDGLWHTDKIVKSYLFAETPWKETTKDWRSLKDKDKRFFKDISEKIGHCPSAIYSLAKFLNNIGSTYLDNGILWFSKIFKKNKGLGDADLESATIYYLEILVRKYIYKNREKIRKNTSLKNNVLTILDLLVEKGSVVGYMLRESIV